MRASFFISFFVVLYSSASAQWSVNTISDSLINNSNAVIRRYASDITIFETGRIVVAENFVITIFDNAELNQLRFYSIISDSHISESLESKIFDASGKRNKQASAKIFQEGAISSSNGSMLRLFSPMELSFPLTIELEYRRTIKSFNDIHPWKPVTDFGVSVQNASFRLSVSDTSLIKFKSAGIPLPTKYVNEDGFYVFLWESKNKISIKKGNSQELPLNSFPSLTLISK